jgi:hypothetical protein
VGAVDALLEDGGLTRETVAGTGLVYVTAAAYGVSNRALIEEGGRALHFAYAVSWRPASPAWKESRWSRKRCWTS